MAERCITCSGRVYFSEKQVVGEYLVCHKICLKCCVCKRTLNSSNYFLRSSSLYCKKHSDELVRNEMDPAYKKKKEEEYRLQQELQRQAEEEARKAQEEADRKIQEKKQRENQRKERIEKMLKSLEGEKIATSAGADSSSSKLTWNFTPSRYLTTIILEKPIYSTDDCLVVQAHFFNVHSLVALPSDVSFMANNRFVFEILNSERETVSTFQGSWLYGCVCGQTKLHVTGGDYKIRFSVMHQAKGIVEFGQSEREFSVQEYSTPPRFRKHLEFAQKGYGAGDRASAKLEITMAEGGVPENAKVIATAQLKGEEFYREEISLESDGSAIIDLALPDEPLGTSGILSVSIDDGSVTESISKTIPVLANNIQVKFYPEGGSIVEGLVNYVYVEANMNSEDPADIDAVIFEKRPSGGEVPIERFHTIHEGRAKFSFTPKENHTYRCEIIRPDCGEYQPSLPEILENGVSLHALKDVYEAEEDLSMAVGATNACVLLAQVYRKEVLVYQEELHFSEDNIHEGNAYVQHTTASRVSVYGNHLRNETSNVSNVDLSLYGGGSLPVGFFEDTFNSASAGTYMAQNEVDDEEDENPLLSHPAMKIVTFDRESKYNKNVSSGGLFRVVVCDKKTNTPFCERIVYRQCAETLRVTVLTDKQLYSSEEVPAVAVKVTLPDGKPVEGAVVSVIATDDSALQMQERRLQHPHLPAMVLLESDVQCLRDMGVYLPEFTKEGSFEAAKLDLLLGVQGWRRFVFSFDSKEKQDLFLSTYPGNAPALLAISIITPEISPSYVPTSYRPSSLFDDDLSDDDEFLEEEHIRPMLYGGVPAPPPPPGALPAYVTSAPPSGAPFYKASPVLAGISPYANITNSARISHLSQSSLNSTPQHRESIRSQFFQKETEEKCKKKRSRKPDMRRRNESLGKGGGRGRGGGGRLGAAKYATPSPRLQYYAYSPYYHSRLASSKETLVNAVQRTGENGITSYTSKAPSAITQYRISVSCFHPERPLLGYHAESFINVKQAFYIQANLPKAFTVDDRIRVPVGVVNTSEDDLNEISLSLTHSPISYYTAQTPTVHSEQCAVSFNSRSRVTMPLQFFSSGKHRIFIQGEAKMEPNSLQDEKEFQCDVFRRDFAKVTRDKGILRKDTLLNILIPETTHEVLQSSLYLLFPRGESILHEYHSLVREPHGCTEQVASTCYLLAVAMKKFKQEPPGPLQFKSMQRCETLLASGYKKLKQMECRNGGFEWWGGMEGHIGITAFIVNVLFDMKEVFTGVEDSLLQSTMNWMLTQRNQGRWKTSASVSCYGRGPKECTEAYVCWTLTSHGKEYEHLQEELDFLFRYPSIGKDTYVLCLIAMTFMNVGRVEDAQKLAKRLALEQHDIEGYVMNSISSITNSFGTGLVCETTSLAVLAWLQIDPVQFAEPIQKALVYIRKFSGRSTQAVALKTKAICMAQSQFQGEDSVPAYEPFEVKVNGKTLVVYNTEELYYNSFTNGIVSHDLSKLLSPGENQVEILHPRGNDLCYYMTTTYTSLDPPSHPEATITMSLSLAKAEINVGENVPVAVKVTNLEDIPSGMVTAQIGVPSGLLVNYKQLQEFVKSNVISFYEMENGVLTLYWRGMLSNESHEFFLNFIGIIPGFYASTPSCIYPYYAPEFIHWNAPLEITIQES